ncbi:hypothetical protein [Microbulbifer thermotolerans]|uniref:hypothetical protein n=1 Tax=Microbulbifer thermotolerans TaxID=252514 RepID=UPI00224A5883|nr:hypothetical protein [Microbulbifer thermotolerans]MCX2834474.1 hypothetical protein [Microbulbifer thermotolerans]
MITVYQIKHPPEYMSGFLNILDLSKQLGGEDSDKVLRQLHTTMMHKEPLSPLWKPGVSCIFKKNSPVSEKVPDISTWGGPRLLLNIRAYELLKERIAPEGEFLPITVDGEPMQVFNCLSFAKEKEELCVRKYFQGKPTHELETLYFDGEDVADRYLFMSKLQGGSFLYCSTQFKALVEELGLEGLRFDENLLSPF